MGHGEGEVLTQPCVKGFIDRFTFCLGRLEGEFHNPLGLSLMFAQIGRKVSPWIVVSGVEGLHA